MQAMFDRVAPRYDLANAVLSFGQDAHWRRVTAQSVQPAGGRILDAASGPGNVALELLRRGAQHVVGYDLSFAMLAEGYRRGYPDTDWVHGDALQLPFKNEAFDAVTISFGLRNVADPPAALREFARVTRPGGRLAVAEFAAPTWAPFRAIYRAYLANLLPRVAEYVSSHGPAYGYLARSIVEWPDRLQVGRWMEAAGYERVQVKDLSGGIVALHRGYRR